MTRAVIDEIAWLRSSKELFDDDRVMMVSGDNFLPGGRLYDEFACRDLFGVGDEDQNAEIN